MTIANKIWNWFNGVKRLRTKGAVNAGSFGALLVKYDWSKPIQWSSKKYKL